MKRISALRGATMVSNEENDIKKKLAALFDALLEKNKITEADIVSLIFSVTPDIDSINPAAALRSSGRAGICPLFCVAEPVTKNAPAGVIRVLLHCYMEEGRSPKYVYQNGAEILRPDLAD